MNDYDDGSYFYCIHSIIVSIGKCTKMKNKNQSKLPI